MATQFTHFTIDQIFHYANILGKIYKSLLNMDIPFTRSDFTKCAENEQWYQEYCFRGEKNWAPKFDTIVSQGFIFKHHEEEYHVYRYDEDSYSYGDIIDMTDEEYNNLPQFFKDMVKIENRKRYYYQLNTRKIVQFIDLANKLQQILPC